MYGWNIIPKTKIIIGEHYKYVGPDTIEDREYIEQDLSHVIVTDYKKERKTVIFKINKERLNLDWLFKEEKFKEYFILIRKEE